MFLVGLVVEEEAIKGSERSEGVLKAAMAWPARRGVVPHGGCKQQGGLVLYDGRGKRDCFN